MKTICKLYLILAASVAAFGQATTTSTTLSGAVSAPTPNSQGTTQWCLASATGVVLPSLAGGTLGSYFAVNQEIVQVTSQGATSTCFNVKRGQLGTSGNWAWPSGATVWVGVPAVSSGDPSRPFSPGAFIDVTPKGACVSTALYTTPLIASGGQTGRGTVQLVQCINSTWSAYDLGASHLVSGTCTLGTSCAVTLPGIGYTSSTSYQCTATDTTSAAATKFVATSATVATFTGTSTDVLSYVCSGT